MKKFSLIALLACLISTLTFGQTYPSPTFQSITLQTPLAAAYGGTGGTGGLTGYAPIASPTFTGTVTIPSGASISGYASLASPTFTGSPVVPGYAPLASPTFTGIVTIPSGASIVGFAPLASPTFTGSPVVPGYATSGANSTITSLSGLTTPLSVAQGGTGSATTTAAFNLLSPITTTGDLIIGNGTNSAVRLPIGANTYVLTSNGTTAGWAANSAGFTNPMTTAGDLILGGSGGSAGRLGIGANTYVLTSNGTTAAWAPSSAGSGTVTSVAVSGGTTGLTTSGGPITTSGTITMAGTLTTASGGTSTAVTGAGVVIEPGYIDGLNCSSPSTTSISISPGSAYIPSLGYVVNVPTTLTITGITGTSGTWHNVFISQSGSTVVMTQNASTGSPIVSYSGGSGYTLSGNNSYRYVCSFYFSGTNTIAAFLENGSSVNYLSTPMQLVSAGTNSASYSAGSVTAATAGGAPPVSAITMLARVNNAATIGTVGFSNADAGQTIPGYLQAVNASTAETIAIPLSQTTSNGTFQYCYTTTPTGASVTILSVGYTFQR